MWDILLRNGFVVDGSGAPGLKADVAISGEKVVAVAPRLQGEATTVVDVSGYVVCPGFMDIHSHADRSILTHPYAESALLQGVTFVLGGQCGGSAAPLTAETREHMQRRAQGFTIDWLTLEEFFQRLTRETIGINIAMLVGQGTIRGAVMGAAERPATSEELSLQQAMLRQAMEQGAFGLSTGRRYMPGCLATAAEIAELNQEIVPFDGLHIAHIINQDKDIIPSIEELIQIGRDSGSRLQLAHQKVCGKPYWGQATQCLQLMEEARAEGIDILSDLYLHSFTQIIAISGVVREFLANRHLDNELLQSPEGRQQLTKSLEAGLSANPVRRDSVAHVGILWCLETKEYEGLDISEGAKKMGCSLAEFMVELLHQNQGQVKTAGIMGDEDIATILCHPFAMVGTDSFVIDKQRIDPLEAHPRNVETYPYTLKHFVYDQKLLSLESCIFKMSGMVARRLNLQDRGLLQPGCYADVTVFDPQTIAPQASLTEPSAYPTGIVHVWVNGKQAVKDGEVTGVRAGQVVKNPSKA